MEKIYRFDHEDPKELEQIYEDAERRRMYAEDERAQKLLEDMIE